MTYNDGETNSDDNADEDHVNDYSARGHSRTSPPCISPPRIEVEEVDFTTPHGRQFSKRRHSCDISSGSRHSKASKRSVLSVVSSVQGPPVSHSASPSVFDLQGASRISGGLLHGKAAGNVGNMADYGLFC